MIIDSDSVEVTRFPDFLGPKRKIRAVKGIGAVSFAHNIFHYRTDHRKSKWFLSPRWAEHDGRMIPAW